MKFDPETHHRRSIRLQGYDYASPGWYYVTICTYHHEVLFGEVIDGQMRRNPLGDIVQKEWFASGRIRPQIRLDAFIVMPNHIHGIIEIVGAPRRAQSGGRRGEAAPRPYYGIGGDAPRRPYSSPARGPTPGSIGTIVGQIKSITTKGINKTRGTPRKPVWHVNYYEHIIRNDAELNRIREYIATNPLRWDRDRYNPERSTPEEEEFDW